MENKMKSIWNQVITQIESIIYRFQYILLGIFVLGLIIFPFIGFNQYVVRIVIMIGVYTMLALGLNILTGCTGLVSLGHAGFFAIGAYTTALLMIRLHVNFFLAIIVGVFVTGLCGFLLGLPTLRLTGSYLSIVTLGFGEIVKMIIMNWDSVTNGTYGVRNIPRPKLFGYELTLYNKGMYYLMLLLVLLVTVLSVSFMKGKTGRAFKAVKEDELSARMMGISVHKVKILAFVISAAITGLAGGYYATLVSYIDYNSFSFDVSILILSIVILGGMGTIKGMFFGAAVLIVFPEISRPLMEWRFVVYGMVLILMMRFCPRGLLGFRSKKPFYIPDVHKYKQKLVRNR